MNEMPKNLDTRHAASLEEIGRICDLDMLDLDMVSGGTVNAYLIVDGRSGPSTSK